MFAFSVCSGTAFAIPLGASDFDAVQTARRHDLDALGTQTHGVLHRTLHGATEHDALFELLRDRIGDQLSIGFRLADFFDVHVHRHAHQALQISLQAFDVFAALADHHARTSRVDGDAGILGGTLDDHATNGGALELLLQVLADANVFGQHGAEGLVVGEPTRGPVTGDRETEPSGVNFLTHLDSLSSDLDRDVAGLLLDTVAAALGARRALHRLSLVHENRGDLQFVDIGAVVVLGVGDGGLDSLLQDGGRLLRREGEDFQRTADLLAADQVRNQASLLCGDVNPTDNGSSFHRLPLRLLVRGVTLERGSARTRPDRPCSR